MLSKKNNTPKSKPGPLIYIGPTIPGVVATATVFNKGIPEVFNAKAQECPYLSELLIPIENAAEKIKEIQKGEGAAAVFYEAAREHFLKNNRR